MGGLEPGVFLVGSGLLAGFAERRCALGCILAERGKLLLELLRGVAVVGEPVDRLCKRLLAGLELVREGGVFVLEEADPVLGVFKCAVCGAPLNVHGVEPAFAIPNLLCPRLRLAAQ